MIKGHGGNFRELARELGCPESEIIDMSSNLNPLGPPEGLISHLTESLRHIVTLPEVESDKIRGFLARDYGLSVQNVLSGNGTTQFIYAAPQALDIKSALILGPCYSDYADACRMHNVPFEFFLSGPESGFVPDFERFREKIAHHDTVFICNPDNPTGHLLGADVLKELCLDFPHVRFIIDESYLPFVKTEENKSMAGLNLPNAIILNSMSKVFRIPGLRIGFVIAPEQIINAFLSYYLPWSVNSLAQEAVTYIYSNRNMIGGFLEEIRTFTEKETALFRERLQGCPGITLFPTFTSFVLGKLEHKIRAKDLLDALAKERILVRNCSNFTGLSNDYVRFSLKDETTNLKLAELIKRILN